MMLSNKSIAKKKQKKMEDITKMESKPDPKTLSNFKPNIKILSDF